MQNKGFVKAFAILLTLVCVFFCDPPLYKQGTGDSKRRPEGGTKLLGLTGQ